MFPVPRFPSRGPRRTQVPPFPRSYQGTMTSCHPSHRTSLPSLGGTSVALVRFAPRRTSAPPRPGVGDPVAPAGNLPRRRQDLPSSWGTPIPVCTWSQTPAGQCIPNQNRTHCMAPGGQKAEAPAIRLLSKLVSMAFGIAVYASRGGLPRPAQDWLPGAGYALLGGLDPQGSDKWFQVHIMLAILHSQAGLAQSSSNRGNSSS